MSTSPVEGILHQPQPIPNPDDDMSVVRALLNTTTMQDGLNPANVPTPSFVQDKKQQLIERLLKENQTYQSLRIENATAMSTSEQFKHDITQFRESLAYNVKQNIILRREREMLEHRFKWTRSDFNTALATSSALRDNIQTLVMDYQREIALSSTSTADALTKLDDMQYFYTTIAQLQSQCKDVTRLSDYYYNDIVVLQSLLQHVISVSFNEQGLPKSNLVEAFQTIPDDEMKTLVAIAQARLAKSTLPGSSGDDTASTTTTTTISTSNSHAMDENDANIATSSSTQNSTSLISVRPLMPAATFITSNTDTDTDTVTPSSIESRVHLIDSFLTKCVSITGHFQPQVMLDHLRSQSDQLLLLQRSHTLLSSQLFQIQQEKALLMAYFESFLKETTSLKQIIHASQFKIDDDCRAIFGLQQRNLVLQQELEFFHQDTILNSTSAQIEQHHNSELLKGTEEMMNFQETTQNSLAVAHMTIFKLRTANEQQNEQILALQAQLAQAHSEKNDLVQIIEGLEKQ